MDDGGLLRGLWYNLQVSLPMVFDRRFSYSHVYENLYIFASCGRLYRLLRLREGDVPMVGSATVEIFEEPLTGSENRVLYCFAKRLFDIVFSIFAIVFFSWLYVLIAVIIKVDDPRGPVFFKQQRVGKDGKLFTMYKFRSMYLGAEEQLEELRHLNEKTGPVFKIADDPRVTRAGKWLRKLSLDELPQFFNTLKGDISIVGPRPALPAEVEEYTEYQRQRLLVPQGITCYWQTRMNRDAISFDEWIWLDLLYVKQCGIWADFKLIVQTVGVVLMAQGR